MRTLIANIDATKLAAIAGFQSTEESRYYLCGVHVELAANGGVTLVATDGHKLGAIIDSNGALTSWCATRENIIIPTSKELLRACKQGRHEDRVRRVEIYRDDQGMTFAEIRHYPSNQGTIGLIGAIFPIALIDGTFPNWRNVFAHIDVDPDAGPGFFTFDPALLKPFALGLRRAQLSFGVTDAKTAIIVRCSSGDDDGICGDFIGVLMPFDNVIPDSHSGLPAIFAATATESGAVAA